MPTKFIRKITMMTKIIGKRRVINRDETEIILKKYKSKGIDITNILLSTNNLKKIIRMAESRLALCVEKNLDTKITPTKISSQPSVQNKPKPKTKSHDELLEDIRIRRKNAESITGTHVNISDGFVYIITNPAYPGCIKIGSAIDYEERLNTFQIYCPYRQFHIEYVKYVDDRVKIEKETHRKLDDDHINGEWYSTTIEEAIKVINE